jgi:serine/threonine protein kinase
MDSAVAHAGAPLPYTFTDGLGLRRRTTDPARHEPIELLCLRGELTAVPSFEFALRERVSHLAGFRHMSYGAVRSVERLKNPPAALVLVSDVTAGARLSDVLTFAEQSTVPLDIDAALCLLRQIVPALAKLHEQAPDVAHGALAPERIVISPGSRVVLVEHVLGAALHELQYSRERYWKELRVAVPGTGQVTFNHRSDVAQLGAVALSLILGRALVDDELPSRLGDVVASSWAISARGGLEPLPAGLRAWLMRALQLDPRESFESAIAAHEELERVLGDSDYMAAPATLEAFLAHYRASIGAASAEPPPSAVERPTSTGFGGPGPSIADRIPTTSFGAPGYSGADRSVGAGFAGSSSSSSDRYDSGFGAAAPERPTPAGFVPPAAPAPERQATPLYTPPPAAAERYTSNPFGAPTAGPERHIDSGRDKSLDFARDKSPDFARDKSPAASVDASQARPKTDQMWGSERAAEPLHDVGAAAYTPPAQPTPHQANVSAAKPPVRAPEPTRHAEAVAPAAVVLPKPSDSAPVAKAVDPRSSDAWIEESRSANARHDAPGSQAADPKAAHHPLPPLDFTPPGTQKAKKPLNKTWIAAAAVVLIAVAAGVPVARRFMVPGAPTSEGTLVVNTSPAGAKLFVDGVERGATPVTVSLKPGPHSLEVRGDGPPRLMPIVITAGAQVSQYLELPKVAAAVGQLNVRTEPGGARVSVDGVAKGTSPLTVSDLAPGEHSVQLESDLGSVKHIVTIEAGNTASLMVPSRGGSPCRCRPKCSCSRTSG